MATSLPVSARNIKFSLCSADVVFLFIFNGPFEDQLSHNVLDRPSPNFQDGYIYWWAWSIRPSICDRSRDVAVL